MERNLKIKLLMDSPLQAHGLDWLQACLQAALELELSTLPPYLCGLYALKDQKSDAAKLIHNIVLDEMCHFGLACNLLWATGMQPKIFDGYDSIVYPGPLPGGVRPKCDPSLRFPCDPNFEVALGFADYESFVRMCMQIEYPEDPVPRPLDSALAAQPETFPTIGEFYGAILSAFEELDSQIPYGSHLDNQIENDFPPLTKIDGLTTATSAINLIKSQGEGASKFPFSDSTKMTLAHFYAFGQIYFGRKYEFASSTQTGDWKGDAVGVPNAYTMTPVPMGGYGPGAPHEVTECDRLFTQMLRQLDQAWSGGGDSALNAAIDSMDSLKSAVLDLFGKNLARPDGGIFGPQFRKIAQ
jgi:hypothetical protein